MKTLFTHLQKVANTPPTYLLVLFAWLLLPFNVSADVTVEWGESFGGASFPSESSSLVNNVTLSTTMPVYYNAWLGGISNAYHYNIGTGSSIDIKASDGYKIKQLKTSVWYNTDVRLTIHFSASSPYDGNILQSVDITGHEQGDANLYDVEVPNGAKSARVVSTGNEGYGAYFYRLQVTIEEADPCSASVTASFSKAASETGEVPANKDICTDYSSSFTIPGKNTLVYDTKHAFVGWEKGGEIYAEGATYTITDADISAGSIEFTAVWSEVNVTDLTITDPVNNTIPLSWKIPGICDVKGGTDPIFIPNNGFDQFGVLISTNYNNEDDYDFITANGNSPIYGQYGIGFDIPATKDLSWFSYEWKGYNSNVSLCATTCSNSQAYWDASSYPTSLNNNTNWTPQGPYTLKNAWWSDPMPSTNPEVSQIVIFANVGTATSGISFSVRNVRYGISGQEDIDHIVLVRKAGSVPANTSDGNVIYTGTKSHFTDTDVKTPGTTYYYAVFAVYSDESVSSPIYVSHTMETVDTYTVTYEKGEGVVTGEVPVDEAEYAENNSVTVAGKNTLARVGYTFGGWNDGSTTYAPDASYTMPAHDVTFTAVWTPFTVPTVTNLAVGEAVDKEVPLSWSIPGICDLSNPKTPLHNMDEANTTSKEYEPEGDDVKVTGTMKQYKQFGVAFDIPATTGIEWVSYDFKGTLGSGDHVWGGVDDGSYTYWHFVDPMPDSKIVTSSWQNSGQEYVNRGYWDATDILPNPLSQSCTQVAIYGNTAIGQGSSGTFYVRNVRYHVANREDIDHVIVVRKAGSAPANPTDGIVYNVGTKSHFLDDDDTKEFGQTYYYSVYAVHADGTVSEATTTSHTIVATSTCNITFNVGDGAIGDAPSAIENKPANGTVTLPSIGSAYKPFYAFTGWKKNNAGDLLAAGSTYTVTAEDVTAETISFTAQWEEDNTTIRIPNTKTFGVSNKPANINTVSDVDFNNDGTGDEALNIQSTAAEWSVFIQPGYYEVSMLSAVWRYGMKYTLSLIDPLTDTPVKTFFTKTISRSEVQTQYINDTVGTFDLTDLIKGKRYVLKIEDTWTGCFLRVHDINFNPVTPKEIASEVVLDAGNTVTTGLTKVTDVDFPGDNDESINLYNKQMDWVVKIAKGYYNISLLYGAPQYSSRVSVALIDPEGVEPTRWFCPDQSDRNGHYHYTSGTEGTQYYSIGLVKRDLYDIDPEKTYIVRVHDEYGSSNSLRVKDLTFTPIAPVEIHEEATLNASNVMVAPSIVDSRIDISNQQEAVWYATIDPHKFDITLTYFAENGGTKVRFAIIPVGGDTIFVHQENKYDASNTTYTIPALDQDLTNISSGVYKIIVKDNYKSNGSKPQIISLTFSRAITTHTRSGLNVGDYGTVCLPYAIEAANINGAEIYKLIEWPAGSCAVTLEQVENMEAGHPYIYQATANTATWRYNAEGDPTDATSENGLIGSYTKELISPNANNYVIYNNKLYYVDSEAYVGANRAYINRTEAENAPTPGPANGRKRIQMAVNGAQVVTGIDQLNDQMTNTKYMENGILYILRDGKLYNAQGQLVK